MSDDYHGDHRGPYTPPSEPPLAFDARRPVRGRGPAPVALIVSGLVLVAVLGGGFFMYRNGLRAPDAPPQPVGAPVGDLKTAPPPEAQPVDPAAGLSVYKDDNAAAAPPPTFAAPPEQPAPRPAPGVAIAPPKPLPAPVAAPVAAAPVAAAPKPQVAVVVAPPKPPVAAPPAKPATPKPSPTDASAPSHVAAASARGGVASVQIGAFSSTQLADRGWNEAARVAPGVMAGKGKKVETVDVGGSTLYRTSITGFASREAAASLCDQLKAAGKTCFVK